MAVFARISSKTKDRLTQIRIQVVDKKRRHTMCHGDSDGLAPILELSSDETEVTEEQLDALEDRILAKRRGSEIAPNPCDGSGEDTIAAAEALRSAAVAKVTPDKVNQQSGEQAAKVVEMIIAANQEKRKPEVLSCPPDVFLALLENTASLLHRHDELQVGSAANVIVQSLMIGGQKLAQDITDIFFADIPFPPDQSLLAKIFELGRETLHGSVIAKLRPFVVKGEKAWIPLLQCRRLSESIAIEMLEWATEGAAGKKDAFVVAQSLAENAGLSATSVGLRVLSFVEAEIDLEDEIVGIMENLLGNEHMGDEVVNRVAELVFSESAITDPHTSIGDVILARDKLALSAVVLAIPHCTPFEVIKLCGRQGLSVSEMEKILEAVYDDATEPWPSDEETFGVGSMLALAARYLEVRLMLTRAREAQARSANSQALALYANAVELTNRPLVKPGQLPEASEARG